MHKPMTLPVAMAQLNQSMADFTAAHDAAMAADPVADKLNAGIALQGLRYIEKNGLTDEGRRRLASSIRAVQSILGVET